MNIAFLGDIALFEWGMLRDGWKERLKAISDELKKYDLVVANLEAPITSSTKTYVCKGIHLKTTTKIIDILKYLNVSVVCLANNHICDYGIKGLKQTIEYLNEAGIQYYGVNGKSLILIKEKCKIAFHGYCCYSTNGAKYLPRNKGIGVNALIADIVDTDLAHDADNGFYSILSFHWGDEYSPYPNEKQVDFVHSLADNYDFIVHGHHAHVMQGIEEYKNSLIAYNQGNFYFDECRSEVNRKIVIKQGDENKQSFILSIALESNEILDWKTQGICFNDDGIDLCARDLSEISEEIRYCRSEAYKQKSQKSTQEQKRNNLVKRDIKWLFSKLNYYSIGANVKYYYYKHKYKDAF